MKHCSAREKEVDMDMEVEMEWNIIASVLCLLALAFMRSGRLYTNKLFAQFTFL